MHILAAREALERFATELPPAAGADRAATLAATTRQLFDQALAEPNPDAPVAKTSLAWADHNLAVLLADALLDPHLAASARALFLGVRRRLIDALGREPHDLAPALALALGVECTLDAATRDDQRLAQDLFALSTALASPHVGARLANAAVSAVVAASQSRDKGIQAAAEAAAPAVKDALDRAARRLPHHPHLLLDRIRLVLLAARADGANRKALIAEARGLLADHEATFGPSAAQRDVTALLVAVASRDESPTDLARDVVRLIELDAKGRGAQATRASASETRRALKLVRTLTRARALDPDTAKTIQKLLGVTDDQGDDAALTELRGLLFAATGDESSLVSLHEQQLTQDPNDQQAARALFERLLKNLRDDLPSPFASPTLDLITQAVPFPALGRLSADDVDAVLTVLRATFGAQRALAFARNKLTVARDLRGKDFVWRRALQLADEAGSDEDRLDLARRALRDVQGKPLPEARLMLARALVARGESLDEADDALRPLLTERGPIAVEAQQLKSKIKSDPRYKGARLATLLAYEEQLGIGTARQHPLRVVFTSPGYLLAEVIERPAPDFYDHKHLRVMIRGEDLPQGVKPNQLKKGDLLEAPVRGQDANPDRDKEGLRIYWIADPRRIELKADPAATEEAQRAEEEAFGIGSGRPLPLRVAWDGRKKRLFARLYNAENQEFRGRPKVEADNLPEGFEPAQCGSRGKRFLGVVERVEGGFRVVGRLELAAPLKRDGATAEAEEAAKDTAEVEVTAEAQVETAEAQTEPVAADAPAGEGA